MQYHVTVIKGMTETTMDFDIDNGIPESMWKFCEDAIVGSEDAEVKIRLIRKK